MGILSSISDVNFLFSYSQTSVHKSTKKTNNKNIKIRKKGFFWYSKLDCFVICKKNFLNFLKMQITIPLNL